MVSECSVEGCDNPPPYVRGMCSMHYTRWKRGTDLHKRKERRGLCLSERFWQYVDVKDNFDECWEWTGTRMYKPWDYGHFMLYPPDVPSKKSVNAQRVAYETFWRVRLVHSGLHRCNNPPCCNPLHIYDGTNSQNQRDSVAAGTSNFLRPDLPRPRGEGHGLAKLTEETVREIRRRYAEGGVSQQRLADECGVNQTKISDVILRKTWRHVE